MEVRYLRLILKNCQTIIQIQNGLFAFEYTEIQSNSNTVVKTIELRVIRHPHLYQP